MKYVEIATYFMVFASFYFLEYSKEEGYEKNFTGKNETFETFRIDDYIINIKTVTNFYKNKNHNCAIYYKGANEQYVEYGYYFPKGEKSCTFDNFKNEEDSTTFFTIEQGENSMNYGKKRFENDFKTDPDSLEILIISVFIAHTFSENYMFLPILLSSVFAIYTSCFYLVTSFFIGNLIFKKERKFKNILTMILFMVFVANCGEDKIRLNLMNLIWIMVYIIQNFSN